MYSNEELAIKIQQGDSSVMADLWEQTYLLIYKMMSRYFPYCKKNGMDPDDLKQSGYFVLLRAVNAYDPEKATRLTSYFAYHVQTVVGDTFGHRGRKGKNPLILSLDEPLRYMDNENLTLGDSIEDTSAVDALDAIQDDVVHQQFRKCLDECLSEIDPKIANIIRARYLEGETLQSIADKMGVSMERIRQWEFQGLRKLRQPSRSQRLFTFLYEDDVHGYGFTAFKTEGLFQKLNT